jgi:hypothetical protein
MDTANATFADAVAANPLTKEAVDFLVGKSPLTNETRLFILGTFEAILLRTSNFVNWNDITSLQYNRWSPERMDGEEEEKQQATFPPFDAPFMHRKQVKKPSKQEEAPPRDIPQDNRVGYHD